MLVWGLQILCHQPRDASEGKPASTAVESLWLIISLEEPARILSLFAECSSLQKARNNELRETELGHRHQAKVAAFGLVSQRDR